MKLTARIALLCSMAVAGCAGPPLSLYTLADNNPATLAPLTARPLVISVARVTIPDALDSEDILVRDGAILRRSNKGRWASRLSIGITDLLTAQLAARRPGALITDQPQAAPVSARLLMDIGQLDINANGTAAITASWTIIPTDTAVPIQRGRTSFSAQGSTATDQDVVTLTKTIVTRLAPQIDLAGLN